MRTSLSPARLFHKRRFLEWSTHFLIFLEGRESQSDAQQAVHPQADEYPAYSAKEPCL